MSMSYEEAFASNLSAWMRRANLPHDKARNGERAVRAQKVMGDSSRVGAMFIVAAIVGSKQYGLTNMQDVVIFAAIVSVVLFKRVYEEDQGATLQMARQALKDKISDKDRAAAEALFDNRGGNIVTLIDRLYQARVNEKNAPSLTNMIIDRARGKRIS